MSGVQSNNQGNNAPSLPAEKNVILPHSGLAESDIIVEPATAGEVKPKTENPILAPSTTQPETAITQPAGNRSEALQADPGGEKIEPGIVGKQGSPGEEPVPAEKLAGYINENLAGIILDQKFPVKALSKLNEDFNNRE